VVTISTSILFSFRKCYVIFLIKRMLLRISTTILRQTVMSINDILEVSEVLM
jgi:hypothetical protein